MFVLVCGLDVIGANERKKCGFLFVSIFLILPVCSKVHVHVTFVLNNFLDNVATCWSNLIPFRAETRGGQVTLSDNVTCLHVPVT